MSHRYFPHTPDDVERMLGACGVKRIEDLYADIPQELVLGREYDLPKGLSEHEVRRFFKGLGDKCMPLTCFAGAGYYDHYAPAVIPSILSRSEFLTAYTPYQPEISQGTLQYIFEYQSMMASLTGLDVSNASMYDGTTATAEAMMMAVAAGRRKTRILISSTVNPSVREVVATYARYHGVAVDEIEAEGGVTSRDDMNRRLSSGDVAGVIVQSPNFYGIIEDYSGYADDIHAAKALMIMNVNPSALAVLKSPGEWGADIAVGDGQPLGIPLSYGGPYLGFLCATKALMRKMPGRIVGATTDADGQRAFVLTLQAREQHIRRDKATSNICSNQSLMALYVTVYMSLMGDAGLRRVNELGFEASHVLCDRLAATGKMRQAYPGEPYLNEFAMKCDFDIDNYLAECARHGILGGVWIDDDTLLLCATQTIALGDIDRLVDIVNNL
ncbi:MAG: aminomethyl-transferring glycine dehydrogenase subunit GcvPA [Muribaculaceae bacterium]|nr:aminomethyl-transferring glycine dehydrogenase subunit GcvPA [Muribaculaceae bacterium]